MIWTTTTTTTATVASLQQQYGGGTHQNHHKNDSISVILLLSLLFNTIVIIIIFLSTTTYSISFLTTYTTMITATTADAFVIQPSPPQRRYISRHIDVPSSLPRAGPTRIEMTSSSTATSTTTTSRTTTTTTTSTTRVPDDDALQQLHQQRYVVIPNFISSQLQNELRNDIQTLRGKQEYFKKANIGQDSTNTYNSTVRITETCFIGKDKHRFNTVEPNQARNALYTIVDDIGTAISSFRPKDTTSSSSTFSVVTLSPKPPPVRLDDTLTELLYAYYPNGGYYRTHMDAIPNSMSYLRQYSFLLYLNTCGDSSTDSTDGTTVTNDHHEWNTTTDGGQLRLYLNHQTENDATTTTTRTLDFTNDAYQKEYDTILDVSPTNGTLVLFDSHVIPHEVLNTYRERYVIIGWFNRPPSIWDPNDYTNLRSPVGAAVAGGGTTTMTHQRMSLLTVAVGMMTYGIYNLIESL